MSNEWIVSGLIVVGIIILLGIILNLKENHQEILIAIFVGVMAILVFIGMTNAVHSFIYELLPTLRGGG